MGIKYKVNENFFDKWKPEMAYVLGYLYADGSLEDAPYLRGKYIRVTSVDESTIIKIKTWLQSEHKIVALKPNKNQKTKIRYLLRIGSHKLYNSLSKIGLYPNKSLTIRLPEIPTKFVHHFVRGYFDGDGCVNLYLSNGKRQRLIIRKLSVIFSSGSKKFLEDLLMMLRKNIPLTQTKIYKGSRCFQLRHSTADSIALFKFLYKNTNNNLFLRRKFDIFLKYFRLRPSKIDNNIKNILKYTIGHVVK